MLFMDGRVKLVILKRLSVKKETSSSSSDRRSVPEGRRGSKLSESPDHHGVVQSSNPEGVWLDPQLYPYRDGWLVNVRGASGYGLWYRVAVPPKACDQDIGALLGFRYAEPWPKD